MSSERLTAKGKHQRRAAIKAIFDAMPPAQGEMRTVEECGDCGQLFGRRFIPYGLGHGVSVNLCGCQKTGNRPSKTIAEKHP